MTKDNRPTPVFKGLDDMFLTDEGRLDAQREKVQEIPLSELHPFPNHPFKVVHDERMQDTAESIREYGVLVPAIARPRAAGGYELVSGHRRHFAAGLAGLETLPVIVRDLDDDAATIIMVDSNIQREFLLPSERAFAYKLKLEAIKHQGKRTDLTLEQVVPKLPARDKIAQDAGEKSGMQVSRYIRLTELIPPLLAMVDERKVAFNPAVEISYLRPEEQQFLHLTLANDGSSPSVSQAQRMKKFSQEGHLCDDVILAIMSETPKNERNRVTLDEDVLYKYFPRSYTPQQMQQKIIELLDNWKKMLKKQREQAR